jgi:hypothetical protein
MASSILHKYFKKEHVNVRFPKPNPGITAKRVDMPTTPMPAVPGGFTPILPPVINLKLEDASQPGRSMLVFANPVEFHIRYDNTHLKAAAGKQLSLGYWEGMWIRFTNVKNRWDPKKGTGLLIVKVDKWGDPPIAVGT